MRTAEAPSIRPEALLAFQQLLASVDSEEELATRLCSEEQRLLLERAAIPRTFSRHLVDTVLLRDLHGSDASWEWLVGRVDIEPVRPYPGEYRMRDSVREVQREQILASMQGDPARWLRFIDESARLAAALDESDARQASEKVYHLAVAAPDECAHLLATLFDAADSRNDFGRCEHLLATVDRQLAFIEAIRTHPATSDATRQGATTLQATLDDRERLFSARRRFAEELRRSAHTLEREFMTDEVKLVGQEADEWIVNVESEGGRGKTAFVNWLIVRHLVPSRVPVAKVDFDDPRWSSRRHSPWEFLLHIATELDVQLPGAPLTSIIDEIRAGLSSDEDHSASLARRRGSARNVELEADLAEDVPRRLGVAIAEATTGPVVVVLDTLEELKLRNLASLLDVVAAIERVHDRCPRLRLYLSGRFSLAERHGDMWSEFEKSVRHIPIGEFTEGEAIDFLVTVRRLEDRELATAVARKTNLLPFQLALAADLVQSRGGLTKDQVDALGNLDLHYLVDRVLRRIDDPRVRWLVRYGVVPRTLTRPFVVDVMLPELRIAMAGDKAHDDPDLDPAELRCSGQQFQTILTSRDAPLDIGEAWTMLEGYASRCSFVASSGDDTGALVFHADVRRPMRRVLQGHAARYTDSAYGRLHRRARSLALDAASKALGHDDAAWSVAMSSALYHSFQLGIACGEETWARARVEMEQASIADEACVRVATELALPEYVDDDGNPLARGDGSTMIRRATLVQARHEAARRAVALARRAETEGRAASSWWELASESLDAIDRLLAKAPRESGGVSNADITLLRAQLTANALPESGNVDGPARLRAERSRLLAARRRSTVPAEQLRLDVAIARLEPIDRATQAIERLRSAIVRSKKQRRIPIPDVIEAKTLLGDLAQRELRLDVALSAADQLIELAERAGPVQHALALVRRANARWIARDSEGALAGCTECKAVLAHARGADGTSSVLEWALQLEGEIHLWRRDFLAIERLVREIERVVARPLPPAASPDEAHALTTLAAFVPLISTLRDMVALRVGEVFESLERARTRYEQLGDHERLMFLMMSELKYCFREMEDLRAAESQAMRVGRTRADDRDTSTIRARALAYEVLMACGRPTEAAEHFTRLTSQAATLDPRGRLLVYVRALATGTRGHQRYRILAQVLRALEAISPVPLRLRLLADQLHPREEIVLDTDETQAIERAIGGSRAYEAWSLDDPSPDAIRRAIDVARVAIALRRVERARPVLDALAVCVRTTPWLRFLPMVQALELDAVRHGYSPRTLAHATATRSWDSAFVRGILDVVAYVQEGALHQLAGDEAEAAKFARRALQSLDRRRTPPTIWTALANELLMACSPRPAECARARSAAIEFYASRYDEASLQRLAPDVHDDDAPPPASDERAVARIQVIGRSSRSTNDKALQLAFGTPLRVTTRQAPTADATWRALHRAVLEGSSSGVPHEAHTLILNDWESFCRSLAAALQPIVDERDIRDGTPGIFDLELQVDPEASVLQAIPWELALAEPRSSGSGTSAARKRTPTFLAEHAPRLLLTRSVNGEAASHPSAHVRWVQRMVRELAGGTMVADGIFGPKTKAALSKLLGDPNPHLGPSVSRQLVRRFTQARRLEKPRIFLMAGDSSLALRRGTRTRALIDPRKVHYLFQGCDTTAVDAHSKGDAMSALREREFDVVILTGGFRFDTRRGGVVFDYAQVGQHSSSARTSGIDAPLLSKLLLRSDRPNTPIVFVDAQVSGSPSERLRSLFLRNLFCAELASKSNVAAVLGTGLENEWSLGPGLAQLLEELRLGHSVAATVYRMRSEGAESGTRRSTLAATEGALLHAALPSKGIALWSDFPHDVFLAGAEQA